MKRLRQLAVVAVLMAIGSGPITVGAQSLNGVITIFDMVGGISAGDIVVLVNDPADPIGIATVYGRQYVLGTVDGAPLRAFLETDLFNAQTTRLVVDGAVLRIMTTATSLGAVDASSETTVRGVIDNDEVSLSFIGPGFDLVTQDRVTVTVNGESLHIRVPPGQSLRALQVDTPVTLSSSWPRQTCRARCSRASWIASAACVTHPPMEPLHDRTHLRAVGPGRCDGTSTSGPS